MIGINHNENISFGFIFIMPPIKEMIMKKLKNYGIFLKKDQSISIVKIIQIEDSIKLELINEIFKTFIIKKKEINEEIKKKMNEEK